MSFIYSSEPQSYNIFVKLQKNHYLCATMSFILIAGPCSAESRSQLLATANGLASMPTKNVGGEPLNLIFRAGLWKPRTHPGSFEGVGAKGLPWLREIEQSYGWHAATEVATAEHVNRCLEQGIRYLWIGARTTANPFAVQDIADALQKSASAGEITVIIKNPVNPDLELWEGAIERVRSAGVSRIWLVHRGFSASQPSELRNMPLWSIPISLRMRHSDLPFLCDPSHISGDARLVPTVSQQALDLNFDGLMVECHSAPAEALSDAKQQLTPHDLNVMLTALRLPQRQFNDSRLSVLRREMSDVDEQLWQLVVKRMEIAEKIGNLKRENNASILQENRFRQILSARLAWGQEHGLSHRMVTEITTILHEESLARQLAVDN